MRQLRHFAWAAAAGLAAASGAAGQTTTGTTGVPTTTTTGVGTTTGGLGGTGFGGLGQGGQQFGAQQLQQIEAAPVITGISIGAGGASGSNAFAPFYANPLYQGRAGSTGSDAPGGFGTPLYTTTAGLGGGVGGAGRTSLGGRTGGIGNTRTTSGTGTGFGAAGTQFAGAAGGGRTAATTGFGGTGMTGGRTGAGGTGFGGTGFGQTGFGGVGLGGTGFGGAGLGGAGLGGLGGRGLGGTGFGGTGLGAGRGSQFGGEVIPAQRQIAYTATVRFPTPAVAPTQMQSDLRAVIDRSSLITNPRGIEISVTGNVVVLRGAVRDEDEAKTAEGMIRLTPGVRDVKNELKYPTP